MFLIITQLLDIFVSLIGVGLVFLLVLFIHELAHKYFLSHYTGNNVSIRLYYNSLRDFGFEVGKEGDYIFLTKRQQVYVYASGILAGLFIIFLFFALTGNIIILLLILPYIIGSRSDIQEIIKIFKGEKNTWEY